MCSWNVEQLLDQLPPHLWRIVGDLTERDPVKEKKLCMTDLTEQVVENFEEARRAPENTVRSRIKDASAYAMTTKAYIARY